ncbi:MAG: GNAT family N-acetyltransferase [bacterium]|nr:GNAT family N-acetyltransferase [bacterium]
MIHLSLLPATQIEEFYPTFTKVIRTQFPGYGPEVIDFLLNRMYNIPNLRIWVQRGDKIIVGAKNDDTFVGFAMIDTLYGGVSFCRWLGVLADFQHKGIGTKLIHEWETIARTQHAHKMEVAGQPTAKVFYEKMGLGWEGNRKASYFGIDQDLFGKVLGSPDPSIMTK